MVGDTANDVRRELGLAEQTYIGGAINTVARKLMTSNGEKSWPMEISMPRQTPCCHCSRTTVFCDRQWIACRVAGLHRAVCRKPLNQNTAADAPNAMWAVDFQFDVCEQGKVLKICSIVDAHTREC